MLYPTEVMYDHQEGLSDLESIATNAAIAAASFSLPPDMVYNYRGIVSMNDKINYINIEVC